AYRHPLAGPEAARRQQIGDTAGQHGGLTRARAGDDQQRRALMQDRLTLLGVQAVEKLIAFGFGHVLRSHVRPNLPPFGDTFALERLQVAHSIRAQYAASMFLRVPASGARGLAASQSPAVRFRLRASPLVG